MQTRDKAPIKILDLSHFQNVINWQAIVDQGYKGVYLKASQGTNFHDATFIGYCRAAQSVGLLVGAYHFVGNSGSTWQDPVSEAANFLNAISSVHLDLLPALDMETDPGSNDPTTWARSFISAVGMPFIFYTYTEWLKEHPVKLQDLPLWIANYSNIASPPDVSGWTAFTMWQYSSTGTVTGIVADGVDLNCAVSVDALLGEEEAIVERTTTSALNLRVAPGADFAIRAEIPKGTELRIDKTYGAWAHTPDGHEFGGWVARKYLTQTEGEK